MTETRPELIHVLQDGFGKTNAQSRLEHSYFVAATVTRRWTTFWQTQRRLKTYVNCGQVS
ncbi:hypothetical protein RRSWK_02051 [Rhodopirellula sp. SWK7]|nr:hypothetical protein RRSWK_02051 [Rhodopirellula sp. SWK7]